MLVVVATPIGNLRDLSPRAAECLATADLVAAEDTRHTGILLQSIGGKKPMVSLHEHNEASRVDRLVAAIESGQCIALVSDAGMPLLSDPGFRLVQACIRKGLPVSVLPGPSAILTALAGSGLPPHPFYFGGFLPVKSGRRQTELEAAVDRACTSVYFESPHRLLKSLQCLAGICPQAGVCVARELSKKFEEFRRGSPSELAAHFQDRPPKGEITLVVNPRFAFHQPQDALACPQ